MLRKSFAICTLALAIVVAVEAASQAAVSSWLSTVGAVDGSFTKTNATLDIGAGESGSLYLWLENTTQLRSVAYDIQSATAGIINFTGVEVYTPQLLAGGTPIGDRWNLPVAAGAVADNSQSITNFGAVNVDKAGLTVATRTFDAMWDATASAALVAKINFNAVAPGSTVLSLSEGLTKIVEAGNPNTPDLTFGNATITVTGGPLLPVVDDLVIPANTVLNATVTGTVTGTDVATWSPTLEFVGYTQAHGGAGETGVTQPAIAPVWNAATQSFSWDTSGSLRGDYVWRATGSNTAGSDTGLISVAQQAVPEPATLALFGLAAVGCLGAARRRS